MKNKHGYEGAIYIQTDGVAGSAGWSEVTIARDVNLNLGHTEGDFSSRGGEWKATEPGMKEASIDIQILWDTDDARFTELRDAWLNKTALGVRILDGDESTPGSEGLKADFKVFDFGRPEPLEGQMVCNLTLKPCRSVTEPDWETTV